MLCFTHPAPTNIYTLSLHDALPIYDVAQLEAAEQLGHVDTLQPPFSAIRREVAAAELPWKDRKSTRLNSSHANISYAVFCLKKKKTHDTEMLRFVGIDPLTERIIVV